MDLSRGNRPPIRTASSTFGCVSEVHFGAVSAPFPGSLSPSSASQGHINWCQKVRCQAVRALCLGRLLPEKDSQIELRVQVLVIESGLFCVYVGVGAMMAIDEDKTEAVLRYLPAMRDDPGRFVEGDGFVPFVEALYGAGLVVEFDWMTWADGAQRYVDDQCLVESADIETIQKLITAHARNDRFCNGHLRGMIMNGHIAAVLTRLAALLTVSQPAVADGLRVCIHRGAHQIGGTCIELECQGKRLVLDVGVPLDADDPCTVEMPDVPGLNTEDASLLGIVISHPH